MRVETRTGFAGIVTLAMVAFLACRQPVAAQHGSPSRKPVLILCSYHPGYSWSDQELAGEVSFLEREHPEIDTFVEFMDWKRYPTIENLQILANNYRNKYRNRQLSLIIANDNAALEFALRNREDLFSNAPIVFAGFNGYEQIATNLPPGVTGVAETINPADTLATAFTLCPDTRHVVIITDRTESGLGTRNEIEAILPRFASRAQFEFIDNLNMHDILKKVAGLPQNSFVYLAYFNRDSTARTYSHEEAAELISGRSNVPVFNAYMFSMGHGVVGGFLLDARVHGEQVGRIASRILSGEAAESIPVVTAATCPPVFDHRTIERFSLSKSLLPKNSRLLWAPDPLFIQYRKWILAVAGLASILFFFNLLLGVHIRRRRAVEKALRESEQRYRSIVEAAREGIWTMDAGNRTVYVNNLMASMLGYTPSDMLNKSVADFMSASERDDHDLHMQQRKAGTSQVFERRFVHRDGSTRLMLVSATPRLDENGTFDGSTSLLTDITERHQMEERLRQSEKMDAIGHLAGGIAHDFNNQLGGIMGYADMLANRAEDDTQRRYADCIIRTAKRAAELTSQLLAFARKGKYLSVPVDLHAVIAEVASILEHSLDKRIAVRQQLSARPSMVLGDPTQLQNALLNLAINARDAMPSGGTLTFSTDISTLSDDRCRALPFDLTPGAFLRIRVTDTGTGMSRDVLKHIFEPFFTTKGEGKGTGLGLAAVYGAVKNHHGAVTVASEPGHGTAFEIHLPVLHEPSDTQSTEILRTPVKGTGCILLVEDEEILRQVTSDMLHNLGYKVLGYPDGTEAVTFYESEWKNIDLVLLDMIMPTMNGRETYLAMKQINPNVRALLLSGYSIDGDVETALDAGILGFMQKPFQIFELSEKVATAIRGGRPG